MGSQTEQETETRSRLKEQPVAHGSVLRLWPEGAPGAVGDQEEDRPSLTVYLPPVEIANGASVVICPGGGYTILAVHHEGHDVAVWLNSLGITAFVLRYRLGPRYTYPAPLDDAQQAIRTVRANAEKWKLDSNRIGMLGFSAGGHLASLTGTHFSPESPSADNAIKQQSNRPDFLILCYPVITMSGPHASVGCRNNLLGKDADPALAERLSSELRATAETPPTFLFHTDSDAGISPEHSVDFYLALRRAGVPAELHIYEQGAHGVGLAPDDPVLSSWPGRARDWMRVRGILPAI